MDTITWLIIGGLAAVAITARLAMLSRSRGSFPNPAGPLPPNGPSAPGTCPPLAPREETAPDEQTLARARSAPPAGGLVPILHPLVRRAAEKVLRRANDPMTKYFVSDGQQIYFNLDVIPDLTDRQTAHDLLTGEDVDMVEMMQLLGRMRQDE